MMPIIQLATPEKWKLVTKGGRGSGIHVLLQSMPNRHRFLSRSISCLQDTLLLATLFAALNIFGM